MRASWLILLVILASGWTYEHTPEEIVAAVWITEGSSKTKYPYGIRSIDTKGDKEYARIICLNSVRNSRKRWEAAGRPGDWLEFFGRRYSPPKENPNWLPNMRKLLR